MPKKFEGLKGQCSWDGVGTWGTERNKVKEVIVEGHVDAYRPLSYLWLSL